MLGRKRKRGLDTGCTEYVEYVSFSKGNLLYSSENYESLLKVLRGYLGMERGQIPSKTL